MRKDPFTVKKHSGKVVIAAVANGSKSTAVKYADTVYYQVAGHGDYVQEKN